MNLLGDQQLIKVEVPNSSWLHFPKWLCLVHGLLATTLQRVKRCQLLRLYSLFSFTKLLKTLQVLIFTAFTIYSIYKAYYCCIICDATHQMCCVKYLKVSFCLFLKFWRNVLSTSRKDARRVTSLGSIQDVNLEHLVQMHFHCIIQDFTKCVLETIKSQLFYGFRILEKRLKDVL